MRTLTTTVYQFNELSDEAKKKAREWWRGCYEFEFDAECVIDDACDVAELMGLDIRHNPKTRADGSTVWRPSVYWSGFWSQGDGASFKGLYKYCKGSAAAVKAHAPKDEELHRIAKALADAQRRAFYQLGADIRQSGRYCHEMSMEVQVFNLKDEYRPVSKDVEEDVIEALRDFARWIYKRLEQEYEYQLADEQIDDALSVNEYEFDEHGDRV
jgi:hypothetical protein